MKTSKLIIALLLSSVLVFQSCVTDQKDAILEVVPELSAPQVPSVDLMTMPTDALSEENLGNDPSRITPFNWLHAALNLVVWNTVVAVNVAAPVAAFSAAAQNDPLYIGNKTWLWEYHFTTDPSLGSKTYVVLLTGQYIDNDQAIEWKMNANELGGFTNFEWYSGVTEIDNSSGSFTINANPTYPHPQFGINFDKTSGVDAILRFTNMIPNDPGNGDYIEYETRSNEEYNRIFELNTSNDHIEINWNDPQGNGRVKDAKRFNDNNWHCWDNQQQDIVCG